MVKNRDVVLTPHSRRARLVSRLLIGCLAILMSAGPSHSQTSVPSADAASEAQAAVARMGNFISNQAELEFETQFSVASDPPVSAARGKARFAIRQPNQFRVEANWNERRYVFVSDGTVLTIHNVGRRKYAQAPVQSSIIGTMNRAAGLMVFQARMLDFLLTTEYSLGRDAKVSATGRSMTVNGEKCDSYTVERYDDRWEVWIASKGDPLPCRLVTRNTEGPSIITQTNEFNWKAKPSLAPDIFEFSPPAGTVKSELIDVM